MDDAKIRSFVTAMQQITREPDTMQTARFETLMRDFVIELKQFNNKEIAAMNYIKVRARVVVLCVAPEPPQRKRRPTCAEAPCLVRGVWGACGAQAEVRCVIRVGCRRMWPSLACTAHSRFCARSLSHVVSSCPVLCCAWCLLVVDSRRHASEGAADATAEEHGAGSAEA